MKAEEIEELLCLYDWKRYMQIQEMARIFRAEYSQPMVRDDIFTVMVDYVQKKGSHLELLRLPIEDPRIASFTVKRKGELFCTVNTVLPLGEQIVSAAKELYTIWRCMEKIEADCLENGSVNLLPDSKNTDAGIFARMILAPQTEIVEQMERCQMEQKKFTVKDIVRLMDCFGLLYDTMILRLYESGMIEKKKSVSLLSRCHEAQQLIEDTGMAARWQLDTRRELRFGTLPVLLRESAGRGRIAEKQLRNYREKFEELKTYFRDAGDSEG